MNDIADTHSGLRGAIDRMARTSHFTVPRAGRKTETQKAADWAERRFEEYASETRLDLEPWSTVGKRIKFDALDKARPRDVRRAIYEIWSDETLSQVAHRLITFAVAAERRSYDRELVFAYLYHLPTQHEAFSTLSEAASRVAGRHDWPWRDRGERHHLWDAQRGTATLGRGLLEAEDPQALRADAGLDGQLFGSEFASVALKQACAFAGAARNQKAEQLGSKLIALFDGMGHSGYDADITYALLNPWREQSPAEHHRKDICRIVVETVGDPRLHDARWAALVAAIGPEAKGYPLIVRRWLTQTAVREFFKIVSRVTNDPKQWAERESFWLAYLDSGVIGDAWFAFGRQAEGLAQAFKERGGGAYAEIEGGSDPSHSSLLMSIGDLVIAEWSHNGACRFWASADPLAPELYKPFYFARNLKSDHGGRGYEAKFSALWHRKGWQANFADYIHKHTGIRHPGRNEFRERKSDR